MVAKLVGGYRSRMTVEERIARQEAKIAKLAERIGELCSQRADLEEGLADLYEMRSRLNAAE